MAHIEELPQSAVDELTQKGAQDVKDYLLSLPWQTWSPKDIPPGGMLGGDGLTAPVNPILKVPTGKDRGLTLKLWKIA